MSLTNRINTGIKEAMKAKDDARKRTLRAIKAQLLLLQTDGTGAEITEEQEIKLLQKMVKERQDSYDVYTQQNREDLAVVEAEELEIIKEFLPEQMNPEDLKAGLQAIIAKVGASSMKDMGKVMGMANKQFAGKADGKTISTTIKELLG